MDISFTTIVLVIVAFLVGSLPTGYFIGCVYGKDLRAHGSGNVGATNAIRTLGRKAGVLTFLGDVLKGLLAVCLGYWAALGNEGSIDPHGIAPILGFTAIAGHCFSPFLRLRGGKGVATGFGVFLPLALVPSLIAFCFFVIICRVSGYVSLSSIIAVVVLPIGIALEIGSVYSNATLIAAVCTALLILSRHRSNISRLMSGKELALAEKQKTDDVSTE